MLNYNQSFLCDHLYLILQKRLIDELKLYIINRDLNINKTNY